MTSYEVMIDLISHTTMETGLAVHAELDTALYPTGIAVSAEELASINIVPDRFHGGWDYLIKPHERTPS